MEDHQFVFVGGLHRSGTSILFRCLKEHPLISGFGNTGVPEDEGQLLQSVYPPAKVHGGPGRFGFDPRAHLTEDSELVSNENRDRLFAEWARFWDPRKPVLLEKSPPNLIRSRFLQAIFPQSWFIMVTRHPIPVSLATRKWCIEPLGTLVQHWLACHETFEQDRPHVRRLLLVRYEDFVVSPSDILRQIYDFIGLSDHPTHLEVSPDINARYLQEWRAGAGDASGGGAEIAHIGREYGARVARFGYQLNGCG